MTPELDQIAHADALAYCQALPDASVDLVVTGPPYFRLRDYGAAGQIGMELTVEAYLDRLLAVTRQLQRVLKPTGSLFLNISDTYAGCRCRPKAKRERKGSADRPVAPVRSKSLMGIPWRLALRMMDEDWILRNDNIWVKPNPKPNSVTDRFNNAHEHVFFFAKGEAPYFDMDAIREPYSPETISRIRRAAKRNGTKDRKDPGRRAEDPHAILSSITRRWQAGQMKGKIPLDVWTVSASGTRGEHYAVMPEKLCVNPILACCPVGGIVLDPFIGSGTTAVVARRLGRHYLGCDLNADYVAMAAARLAENGT